MTDKEKIQNILNNTQYKDIEGIFNFFLEIYENTLSLEAINELHNMISRTLSRKIEKASEALSVASERAEYIKSYLDGSMWKDEESAKANLQPQIDNTQTIIDVCERVNSIQYRR